MRSRLLQVFIHLIILVLTTCLPSYAGYRHGGGVWIVGPRWVAPYPYLYSYPNPYPYYYTVPQPLVIREYPEIYMQKQMPEPSPAPEQTYWYYCPSPQGYYPYVKECPSGWMKVVPTPPNGMQTQPLQPQK